MQITPEILSSYKYCDLVPLECPVCKKIFTRLQKRIKSDMKYNPSILFYCSFKCMGISNKKPKIKLNCFYCKEDFELTQGELNKRLKVNIDKERLCCSNTCANKVNIIRSPKAKLNISNAMKKYYIENVFNTAEYIISWRGKERVAHFKCKCKICGKEFSHIKRKVTCSPECNSKLSSMSGKKGGSKTASLSFHKRNRSKNEKLFYSKIKEIFPDTIKNERIFNGSDADIIIPSIKLAIHWNGKWHYQNVFNNEKGQKIFDTVKKKDVIRYSEVEKCGYRNYIIKDMGIFNEQKVLSELKIFKDSFLIE